MQLFKKGYSARDLKKRRKKKDSNCAKLDVTVLQRKRRIKGEVDERSSEDEGVKGEALFGLSQPYLGCG